MQSVQPAQPVKHYSRLEISKHANEKSLWIILNGHVYDMTDFIKEHPGRREALLRYAGKDATHMFNSIPSHQHDETLAKLAKIQIGKLVK